MNTTVDKKLLKIKNGGLMPKVKEVVSKKVFPYPKLRGLFKECYKSGYYASGKEIRSDARDWSYFWQEAIKLFEKNL